MPAEVAGKSGKYTLCLRIDHHVIRQLKLAKAKSDKPLCELIEDAVRRQYGIHRPAPESS
jgi:hypothetical protein